MSHNNSSSCMDQDPDLNLGSEDGIIKSGSTDYFDINNNNNFKMICSNCKAETSVDLCEFVPVRQDLKSILESDLNGLLILTEFEKSGHLSENDQNSLSQILISREIYSILKTHKATLKNPLKKLE